MRLVFLEDYDMNLARYMVQGVDVWLNTPIRPREASGTSGIKAAANGVLNLSILDGWWAEAYTPEVGWTIGHGEVYDDRNYQDHIESNALYDLLEQEVIPLFYKRSSDGLPRGWIEKIKASMKAVCPTFNTHRMLREYTENYYTPACTRYSRFFQDDAETAKSFAGWKQEIQEHWPQMQVQRVHSDIPVETQVGVANNVRAEIHLGELTPQDVTVELYHGPVDTSGEILEPQIVEMEYEPAQGSKANSKTGVYSFVKQLTCKTSGMHGFTVRVLPHHPEQVSPFETGLILWS
jgi:starch phosphorylase